jgi:hypothetical protein
MSVRGKGWEAYLNDAPERVVDVIENAPFPLADYDGSKLTYKDKKRGMVTFKGGNGRGHINMKSGMESVVYFDPAFCEPPHVPINIPDPVLARHSDSEVLREFENL